MTLIFAKGVGFVCSLLNYVMRTFFVVLSLVSFCLYQRGIKKYDDCQSGKEDVLKKTYVVLLSSVFNKRGRRRQEKNIKNARL